MNDLPKSLFQEAIKPIFDHLDKPVAKEPRPPVPVPPAPVAPVSPDIEPGNEVFQPVEVRGSSELNGVTCPEQITLEIDTDYVFIRESGQLWMEQARRIDEYGQESAKPFASLMIEEQRSPSLINLTGGYARVLSTVREESEGPEGIIFPKDWIRLDLGDWKIVDYQVTRDNDNKHLLTRIDLVDPRSLVEVPMGRFDRDEAVNALEIVGRSESEGFFADEEGDDFKVGSVRINHPDWISKNMLARAEWYQGKYDAGKDSLGFFFNEDDLLENIHEGHEIYLEEGIKVTFTDVDPLNKTFKYEFLNGNEEQTQLGEYLSWFIDKLGNFGEGWLKVIDDWNDLTDPLLKKIEKKIYLIDFEYLFRVAWQSLLGFSVLTAGMLGTFKVIDNVISRLESEPRISEIDNEVEEQEIPVGTTTSSVPTAAPTEAVPTQKETPPPAPTEVAATPELTEKEIVEQHVEELEQFTSLDLDEDQIRKDLEAGESIGPEVVNNGINNFVESIGWDTDLGKAAQDLLESVDASDWILKIPVAGTDWYAFDLNQDGKFDVISNGNRAFEILKGSDGGWVFVQVDSLGLGDEYTLQEVVRDSFVDEEEIFQLLGID